MNEEKTNNNELPKEIKSDNDNTNPLLDIISTIQEKLDTSNMNTNTTSNNTYPNQNTNYSTYTQSTNFSQANASQNNNDNNFDFSKLFEMFNTSNNTQKNTSSYSNPFMNIDMETMMRVGKIFSTMNREDPRKNLLLSLKPFLRDNRQKNVDTYIFLLGILNVLDSFNNGDSGF